jgi:phytoene synthase
MPAPTLQRPTRALAWPTLLLSPPDAGRIARLHALCGALCALSGSEATPQAAARLARIRAELAWATPRDPLARDALDLLPAGAGRDALGAFLAGLRREFGPVALADEAALMRHAHSIHGMASVMVCAALGASLPPAARGQVVALGQAMRLTSIARDVIADARAGRRFLPATWLPLSPAEIAAADRPARRHIARATAMALRRAEPLYGRGRAGIATLPPRLRPAAFAAAAAHRETGRMLLARGCDPRAPRATVSGRAGFRATWAWLVPHPSTAEALHAPT